MPVYQGDREIKRQTDDPSPLHFVTAGGPRVELVRGDPGLVLTGASGVTLSLDGTSWVSSITIPSGGYVFARYTPSGAITGDAVKYPQFNVGPTPYHCEALELVGVATEARHALDVQNSIPGAFRTDSAVVRALLATLAWATYPLRALSERADVLNDATLTPGHLLDNLRVLYDVPSLAGFPLAARRGILENVARWYSLGGSTTVLQEIVQTLTGINTAPSGMGPYSVEFRLTGLPVSEEAFQRLVSHWMPAWVSTTYFFGYYFDAEIYYDGATYYDGRRF